MAEAFSLSVQDPPKKKRYSETDPKKIAYTKVMAALKGLDPEVQSRVIKAAGIMLGIIEP
jgi:hypothetical protein